MKKFTTILMVLTTSLLFVGNAFAAQLDDATQQALIEALNDEYKAQATYQKVLEQFGDIRPFSNIIKAEETHIQELLPLFEKYGVAVPENDWYDKVPSFATVQEALEAGIQAEIENAAMYDEFFKFVTEDDIITVFTQLRDASQEKHLPAFQRAAERGTNPGGRGQQQPGRGQNRNAQIGQSAGQGQQQPGLGRNQNLQTRQPVGQRPALNGNQTQQSAQPRQGGGQNLKWDTTQQGRMFQEQNPQQNAGRNAAAGRGRQ